MEKQAVYGILWSQDRKKILLVKRRDLPVWVFPGGGLDEGETPEEGVLREVEEETGLKVKILRKIAEYLPVNRMTQKTHFFECTVVKGTPKTSSESKEIAFFGLDQLPKRLPPPFPGWIQDALLGQDSVLIKPIEGVNYLVLVKLALSHPILVARYFLTKIGIRFNEKD